MFDPNERIMRPVPQDETKMSYEQRNWTKFQEGETIHVKGIAMYVHEIGASRLILKFK